MSWKNRTPEYRRAWWEKNKERLNKKRRDKVAADRDGHNARKREEYARKTPKQKAASKKYMREYRLKNVFGISADIWQTMFEKQGERCACCGATEPKGLNWHTDHDHQTGEVRGIICMGCNVMLGRLGDTLEAVVASCTMYSAYLKGAEPVYRNPSGEICKENDPGARLAIWEPKKKEA